MNDQYQALYESYSWLVPTAFNIAEVCCHRWSMSSSDARRIAIYAEDEAGNREVWTYERLGAAVNQLANGFMRMGLQKGERIGIMMGQRPENLVAHLAAYTVGAVAVPLSERLEPEVVRERLLRSEVQIAIVDFASSACLLTVAEECPALRQVIGIGFADERVLPWRSLLARQPTEFTPVPTRHDEPALLSYTGEAKNADSFLFSHQTLIGSLPGFVASQDWFPKGNDVFWTPQDWTRSTGLLNAVLPALYFGRPVVASRGPLTAERAQTLLERYQISNIYLDTQALQVLADAPSPADTSVVQAGLRALAVAVSAEGLPESLRLWSQQNLSIEPNIVFGGAAGISLVGDSNKRWPSRAGSLGRAYPGHRVTMIDSNGTPVDIGKTGDMAWSLTDVFEDTDPGMPAAFWPGELAGTVVTPQAWTRLGVRARQDKEGYFWPVDAPIVTTPVAADTIALPPAVIVPPASTSDAPAL